MHSCCSYAQQGTSLSTGHARIVSVHNAISPCKRKRCHSEMWSFGICKEVGASLKFLSTMAIGSNTTVWERSLMGPCTKALE